ncbi:MAG: IPExxxVDY family protein [Cytophagaceae bacterium]
MKTTKLVVDYDYDFDVLALISAVKAHKLAWLINKLLNIQFCKAEDLCFDFVKESKLVITNYIYEREYGSIRLIKNKSCEFENTSKPYLIPELKEYDYFIQLHGEVKLFEPEDVIEKLKPLTLIQYIKKIDVNHLKSKENLIF